MSDPFDLDKLVLSSEQVAKLAPLQKKPSSAKPRRRNGNAAFVMLPSTRTLAAAGKLKTLLWLY
jgi:hypothetical protein